MLLPASRPRAHAPTPPRPVGPKLTPLLRIQGPAIVEGRDGQVINHTTGSTIANRVGRSTYREPSAFERNTGYTIGAHLDFRDAGANKSNSRDILT